MAKEAFYFSHDTGARNDPKLQKVLMRLGHVGKSVFWDLVEMLHEEGGYLALSECENYAFALRTDIECITSLINDFGLFKNDGEKFWSESALRRIEKREAKSKKAAESAISRWKNANAPKDDANALRPESDGNAIKERKGKENKENKHTDVVSEFPFELFWEMYDKKEDRKKSEAMWGKLKESDKKKIIEIIPKYKERTPDKKFRKNPITFFNNRTWEDEELNGQQVQLNFNHAVPKDQNEW